jgi:integrase
MARLTALTVSKLKKPGFYLDGDGLYLRVSPVGTKSWTFRYRMNGRKTPRDMGLGSLADVSLAEARELAYGARKLIAGGTDPIEAKRESRANLALERANTITFKDATNAYIEAHSASWRNPKHAQQWPNSMEAYVYPTMGILPVGKVDVNHVINVLEPIWTKKPETASRVRGRVEAVLDWAKARGYRTGENPARWRGHLENLMPKPEKLARVRHYPALPYGEIGAFMEELKGQEGIAAMALRFLILTAARTSEVTGARWSEIDLGNRMWTVPAERIKTCKEHRVPLSVPALSILRKVKGDGKSKPDAFVFPGGRINKPLSNNAMLALMKRMKREKITAHGFRSTFRDWCSEQTNCSRDVAETALAHAIDNKVEAAYRRGDLIEKRALLMEDWAIFCGTIANTAKEAKIIRIGQRF